MSIRQNPGGQTSYDRIEYIAASFPRLNPARIGAVGFLLGMRPKPASRCRVLELGCGQGFTLLALAQIYPDSEFHGIDLSAKHIENASKLASEAGLTNVRFEHRSITDITPEKDGNYDYIICHGVYSWVPADVKEKILQICGQQLSPQGIGYVSYNTLPGWAHLRVIREILMYHTQRYEDPMEKYKQARTLVAFLRETAPGGQEGWLGKWLQNVETLIGRSDPAYFLHEYLEETNDPCYFYQFMERAHAQGLQYLSEITIASTLPSNLGAQASKVIEMLRRSVIDAEQYMDFARNTQFRSTLLCRADQEISRNIDESRLKNILYATALRPENNRRNLTAGEKENFILASGAKFTSHNSIAKAALYFLAKHHGTFLSIPAILDGAKSIMQEENFHDPAIDQPQGFATILNLASRFLQAGAVEISMSELGSWLPQRTLADKPLALPLARVQAAHGFPILRGDLRSEKLTPEAAAIVPHCDGTRSIEELFTIYRNLVEKGELSSPVPRTPEEPPDLKAAFNGMMTDLSLNGAFWKPLG